MSTSTLVASSGRATGSAASRRLRAQDQIPAVLYGHGMTPLALTVERRDLRLALSGPAGVNTVLNLTVDGSAYNAVVKELQRHPVKRTVSHVDFLQVSMHEEITVHIPLRLEGEAKAVQTAGGLVDPAVDTIEVVTTPANMPAEFVVDISDMQPDTVIRLADLAMPTGVTATGDPEMPIVTVLFDTAAVAEIEAMDAAVDGEAAADGEAGASAGGEASGDSAE